MVVLIRAWMVLRSAIEKSSDGLQADQSTIRAAICIRVCRLKRRICNTFEVVDSRETVPGNGLLMTHAAKVCLLTGGLNRGKVRRTGRFCGMVLNIYESQ